MEALRIVSVMAVLSAAGGLTAFLFHDVDAVTIVLDGPTQVGVDDAIQVAATVSIPAGQRLPVAGATMIVERLDLHGPLSYDEATCWALACEDGLRHAGQPGDAVTAIVLTASTSEPAWGDLWVRTEGYGQSSSTGYGAEVEPQRRRVATDLTDAEGNPGRGLGYGGDAPVDLRFEIEIPGGRLEAGSYQLTFLVQTGSAAMGPISSPRMTIFVQ